MTQCCTRLGFRVLTDSRVHHSNDHLHDHPLREDCNPVLKKMRFVGLASAEAFKWLLCFLRVGSVFGTVIQDSVLEVSALISTNVTLHCDVIYDGDVNFVLWKKIFNDDHDKVLVHNNHTTDVDKYRVNYPYGLDILGLQVDDEATYQCEINDVGARAILKVLVPASNLTISAGGDIRGGGPFNLTCHAQHARPPATLTWFRGITDVTARAGSYARFYNADGYGDSVSVLHVPTDWEREDVVFRCVASVGDPSADQTAFLFLPLTGGATCMRAALVVLLVSITSLYVALNIV